MGVSLPPGWLTDPEAGELRRLAAGRTVLELGAWKGRSTVVLAAVAEHVVSVDRHQGIPGHGESLSEYLANVRELLNVTVVIGAFAQIVPHLHGFDLVYIDGDHDQQSVTGDTMLARLTGAAVIAYHDWDIDDVRIAATAAHGRGPDGLVGSVASYLT